ncbi:MAG: DUF3795 domain-containing protein [Brevinematales bacterium]|nr:DUF3795 domain-containing protein [Brevinematales bacterium]
MRKHPEIGCCGLECGLCPRYYTDGGSRCPGCGGEGFEEKHPSCGFVTCCVKKHETEACGLCAEFPCGRFDNETGEHDSFITHRNVMSNSREIGKAGMDAFIKGLAGRMSALEIMLRDYDDGRSKSFYCLACALLSPDTLKSVIGGIPPEGDRKARAKELRERLEELAGKEGIELKLRL